MVRIAAGGTIGNRLSFEDHLQFVSRLGFKEVDLLFISDWAYFSTADLAADYEGLTRRVLNALEKNKLRAASMNIKLSVPLEDKAQRAQRDAEMQAVLRFMHELGTDRLSMIPAQTENLAYLKWIFQAEVEELKRLQKCAREEGVFLGLEPHILTSFCHSDVIRSVIEENPDFLVTFDPSHFLHSGERTQEMGFIAEHTRLVHLRDACKGQMGTKYGEGTLDLPYCIGELKKANYDGPVILECMIDRREEDLVENMMLLKRKIEELFEI